jgi:hypothetical protein
MFRFGNREKAVFIFVIGMVPILIIVIINNLVTVGGEQIPFWYNALLIMGTLIEFMGLIWIISKVSSSRTVPLIDDTEPNESVVIRVTKDGIIIPLICPKGTYGTAQTLCYGNDADFIDTGDFPLRTVNGNPAMIVFDMLNTSQDLRRSVARSFMKRHVESGRDGYKTAKIKGKVIPSE